LQEKIVSIKKHNNPFLILNKLLFLLKRVVMLKIKLFNIDKY